MFSDLIMILHSTAIWHPPMTCHRSCTIIFINKTIDTPIVRIDRCYNGIFFREFITYLQGFLTLAWLKGGFQSLGFGFEWHFLHDKVVIGKETLPWQTPHFCPRRIADILIWLAPFWGINILGWQLEQWSHWVCGLCGKTTSGIDAFTSRTMSRSITNGSTVGSTRSYLGFK